MAAVSGKFNADFASFFTAVDQSLVKFRGFEAGVASVEGKLNKMVDNFSGRKIISEATLMAEAVERIGGKSKLTEAELQRMGSVAAEAAAKLRAFGQDVPKGIQDLATHAKTATSQFDSLKGVVSSLAAGFIAMFTARAAFNFVNSTIQEASALKDLAQQTHISVEELQVLAGAMSEFGVDADTLGKGLFTLSRKIAHGDDSIATALGVMGLSLQDVANLNGEALFLKIMKGLSTLQGGLRDDTASEIFGSRLGMAMAGASEGIEGAMATWKRLNHVASTESVNAMDEFDESIKRANKSLGAIAGNMIGPVAQGFNVLFDAAAKGASKWDLILGMLPKGLGAVGTGVEGLATVIDHLNLKTDVNLVATTAVTGAQTKHAAAVKVTAAEASRWAAAMDELNAVGVGWLGTLEGIDGEVVEAIKYYLAAGVAQNTLATAYGLTAVQIKAVSTAMSEELAMAKVLADFNKTAAAHQAELDTRAMKAFADKNAEAAKAAAARKQFDADFLNGALENAQAQDKLNGIAAQMPPVIDKTAASFNGATQAAGVFMQQISKLIDDPRIAGYFGGGVQESVVRTLMGNGITAGEAAAMAAGQFIQRAGANTVQHRASGGSVFGGQPYMVGERGPELFTPGSGGFISPNNSGGMIVNVNVTGSVLSTKDELARLVRDAMVDYARNSGRRL